MKLSQKDYYDRFLFCFGYSLGYYLLLILGFVFFTYVIKSTPFTWNMLYNWDAEHYVEIRNNGYCNFDGLKGDERAFFPFFPLLWKFTGLSQIGISIFNFIVFSLCQAYLFTELKVTRRRTMILMSFPSLIFMLLPYSESMFYLGSVLLCVSIYKDKFFLVLASFFFISLTRPVYSILLPAYALSMIFTEKSIKGMITKTSLATLMVLCAVFCVSLLQYQDSGEWLGFIRAQQGAPWFNVLQVPTLPFRSYAKFPSMPLDALAFVTGLIALVALGKEFITRFISSKQAGGNAVYIMSLLYVLGISLAVFLFRGGSFHSLNRFVFCTVYIQLMLLFYWRNVANIRVLYLAIPLLTIVWYFFNGFTHISLILSYFGLLLYLICFVNINNEFVLYRRLSMLFVLISSFVVQIYFLYGFFHWNWIA